MWLKLLLDIFLLIIIFFLYISYLYSFEYALIESLPNIQQLYSTFITLNSMMCEIYSSLISKITGCLYNSFILAFYRYSPLIYFIMTFFS